MNRKEAFNYLKKSKIFLESATISKTIQEKLFGIGFKWKTGEKIIGLDYPFLYLNEDGTLMASISLLRFGDPRDDFRRINYEVITKSAIYDDYNEKLEFKIGDRVRVKNLEDQEDSDYGIRFITDIIEGRDFKLEGMVYYKGSELELVKEFEEGDEVFIDSEPSKILGFDKKTKMYSAKKDHGEVVSRPYEDICPFKFNPGDQVNVIDKKDPLFNCIFTVHHIDRVFGDIVYVMRNGKEFEMNQLELIKDKQSSLVTNASTKENSTVIFKPYDKVLVRDGNEKVWACNIYSHTANGKSVCIDGKSFAQIIPFNGNEALCGTTKIPEK